MGVGSIVPGSGIAPAWLFFRSADLRDMNVLVRYAPVQALRRSDLCLGEPTAIPCGADGRQLARSMRKLVDGARKLTSGPSARTAPNRIAERWRR
jgi:hypothetical protein